MGRTKRMTTINEFIMKNLIYSEDTQSFVMRLTTEFQKKLPESKLEIQETSWKIIKEMNETEKEQTT